MLASEIRSAHTGVEVAMRSAIERALEAGRALMEAKALLKHGEWLPWLKEHCQLSERNAQRYMRLTKYWSTIEAKTTRASDLSLNEALCLLDGRTELERSLVLEAEQNALHEEALKLSSQIPDADIPTLVYIIERCGEIQGRHFENRLTAEWRLGKMLAAGDARAQ